MFLTRFIRAEILHILIVLVGRAIRPAPAVPALTKTSARLIRVQAHGSHVDVSAGRLRARGIRPAAGWPQTGGHAGLAVPTPCVACALYRTMPLFCRHCLVLIFCVH